MKLITCAVCGDVVALRPTTRKCECGICGGRNTDQIRTEIWGPCVTIGFDNNSLLKALRTPTEPYGLGREFKAFIIPELCNTIKRISIPPEEEANECQR